MLKVLLAHIEYWHNCRANHECFEVENVIQAVDLCEPQSLVKKVSGIHTIALICQLDVLLACTLRGKQNDI